MDMRWMCSIRFEGIKICLNNLFSKWIDRYLYTWIHLIMIMTRFRINHIKCLSEIGQISKSSGYDSMVRKCHFRAFRTGWDASKIPLKVSGIWFSLKLVFKSVEAYWSIVFKVYFRCLKHALWLARIWFRVFWLA